MNGSRYYAVRVEGAKYGVGFGSALAIAISYTEQPFDPVGDHRWDFRGGSTLILSRCSVDGGIRGNVARMSGAIPGKTVRQTTRLAPTRWLAMTNWHFGKLNPIDDDARFRGTCHLASNAAC